MEASKSRYKVTILPMSLDLEKNFNNLVVDEVVKFIFELLSKESIKNLESEVTKKLLNSFEKIN